MMGWIAGMMFQGLMQAVLGFFQTMSFGTMAVIAAVAVVLIALKFNLSLRTTAVVFGVVLAGLFALRPGGRSGGQMVAGVAKSSNAGKHSKRAATDASLAVMATNGAALPPFGGGNGFSSSGGGGGMPHATPLISPATNHAAAAAFHPSAQPTHQATASSVVFRPPGTASGGNAAAATLTAPALLAVVAAPSAATPQAAAKAAGGAQSASISVSPRRHRPPRSPCRPWALPACQRCLRRPRLP